MPAVAQGICNPSFADERQEADEKRGHCEAMAFWFAGMPAAAQGICNPSLSTNERRLAKK